MFTGIVTCTGTLLEVQESGDECSIVVGTPALAAERRRVGDSVAVQGVCLTVCAAAVDGFCADLSAETLRSTTLGRLARGDRVNIEPALRLGEPLGGHLVTGHVDGVSLTVNAVETARFSVSIVPHTLAVTSLDGLRPQDRVNLEVDLVARYLARYMDMRGESQGPDRGP